MDITHVHDALDEERERGRRSPRTLRFDDPELERAYQDETTPPLRARRRRAFLTDAPLWLIGGIAGPLIIGVDPRPFWLVAGGMVVVVIVSSYLAGLAPDRWWLDLNSVTAAAIASVAILALARETGTFDRFAALAIGAAGVEVITTYRLSFVFSLALAAAQLIAFTIAGASVAAMALPFQILLLFLVLGLTCWGTYISENRVRTVFAGRRLIADLHRRVNALFHQYLSPDVADVLLEHPERAELGGEVVEVTVMFADLRDFTSFSEKVEPHAVVEMLNATFSAAVPIVFAEGGTITQFAGDALMAIFNAPVRQPDHALRAARTALALQQAVATVPGAADRPSFRVGLNSGPALVGNIGSAEIRNFTAIGDTTNLAARLHGFAQPGGIVMGERTREILGELATVRALGTPELKGKSPVPVYELIELRADAGAGETPSVKQDALPIAAPRESLAG
jgi:class 3 adenylate cyclase